MNDPRIREKIHRAVDVHGASLPDDPYLAQRILASANRKEAPRMRKLSTGMIIAIVLMLLSVTAVAVGLTIEDVWQQSFQKMNTSGLIWKVSDETNAELPLEDAIRLAKEAIMAKYGTPESELDAMGVYPTYIARDWEWNDGDTPSEWDIEFSSVTGRDIRDTSWQYDKYGQVIEDYGPTGRYQVYINAETKEILFCNWYTNDFWAHAQRVWDCGSYDEVYWWYQKPDFYDLPLDQQTYWKTLLAEKGYEILPDSRTYIALLRSSMPERMYCNPAIALRPETNAQAAAAWQAIEDKYGFSAELLQRYSYIATPSEYQTGTDDIFIAFNENEFSTKHELDFADKRAQTLYTFAERCGAFLVAFDPGTTDVCAVTQLWYSQWNGHTRIRKGPLLERTDWEPDDLLFFDESYRELVAAIKRMRAAGLTEEEIDVVADDYLYKLGLVAFLQPAPEEVNAAQWFDAEHLEDVSSQEAPQNTPAPEAAYDAATLEYGYDMRFWPQELLVELGIRGYRMPKEGEMSIEEATRLALDALKDQQGVTDLTGWTVNTQRYSLTLDPEEVDCCWWIYITDDPTNAINGWAISMGEWEDLTGEPHIKVITDGGNG